MLFRQTGMNKSLPFALLMAGSMFVVSCSGSDSVDVSAGDTLPGTTVPDGSAPEDSVPDDDAPLGVGPYPIASLEVTVSHPEFDDLVYTISCLGDTATIAPDVGLSGDKACRALNDPEVRKLLAKGSPADQICTEVYGGPDVAWIRGDLNGESVDIQLDRINGCGIDAWESLGAALPASQGL